MLLEKNRGAGASGEPALDLAPIRGTARQAVHDLAAGDPELDLVVARTLDVAGDRDDLGPGRLLASHRAEPVHAPIDDQRGAAQRLHVVDQSRALVEALVRRKG